jgi:hypothetical protein
LIANARRPIGDRWCEIILRLWQWRVIDAASRGDAPPSAELTPLMPVFGHESKERRANEVLAWAGPRSASWLGCRPINARAANGQNLSRFRYGDRAVARQIKDATGRHRHRGPPQPRQGDSAMMEDRVQNRDYRLSLLDRRGD